jgi:hypothetical protein
MTHNHRLRREKNAAQVVSRGRAAPAMRVAPLVLVVLELAAAGGVAGAGLGADCAACTRRLRRQPWMPQQTPAQQNARPDHQCDEHELRARPAPPRW